MKFLKEKKKRKKIGAIWSSICFKLDPHSIGLGPIFRIALLSKKKKSNLGGGILKIIRGGGWRGLG
jgi:hypothetical protein